MTSKPMRKLGPQVMQESEPVTNPKPLMKPAKPQFKLKQEPLSQQPQEQEQILMAEDQPPQPAQTKPSLRVRRAVEPQPDPFGDSQEASQQLRESQLQQVQVSQLKTTAVNKPSLRPTVKKQPTDFQQAPIEDVPSKNQSREREYVEPAVKPSKPFQMTLSKFPKVSAPEQEQEEPVAQIPDVKKFPEQSGRRTPYTMGARAKISRPNEDGTSIPVSDILQQGPSAGPQMNLFKNKLKKNEEKLIEHQEKLRQDMVRTQVTVQNPILVSQDNIEVPIIQTKKNRAPQEELKLEPTVKVKASKEIVDVPKHQGELEIPQKAFEEKIQDAPKHIKQKDLKVGAVRQQSPPLIDSPKTFRQINIESDNAPSRSQTEDQLKRYKDLHQLITLEQDSYDLLSLAPRTPYDIYFSQLQSRMIANSCNQAFDDVKHVETETEPMTFNDFGNQAPEDLQRTFIKGQTNISRLNEFLESALAVVEEILDVKKGKNQDKDTFFAQPIRIPEKITQQFKVTSKTVMTQDQDLFRGVHLKSQDISCSVVVQTDVNFATKLFYTQETISSMTVYGQFIVCGTQEGTILIWDRRDNSNRNKNSEKLQQILDLPVRGVCYSSALLQNVLDALDHVELHSSSIVDVKFSKRGELISMDVFGRVIIWHMRELSRPEQDRLREESNFNSRVKLMVSQQTDFGGIRSHFFCDEKTLLVCGSSGDLLKTIDQPRHYGNPNSAPPTYVAVAEKFYYVGAQDGSLKIFHKTHPLPVLQIQASKKAIQFVFLFDTVINVDDSTKTIQDLNRFSTLTSDAVVLVWDLTKSNTDPIQKYDLNKETISEGKLVYAKQINIIASFSNKHINAYIQTKDYQVIQQIVRLQTFMEANTRKLQEDNQMLIDSIIGDYKGY